MPVSAPVLARIGVVARCGSRLDRHRRPTECLLVARVAATGARAAMSEHGAGGWPTGPARPATMIARGGKPSDAERRARQQTAVPHFDAARKCAG